MKYLGVHPDAYEYCIADTLEELEQDFRTNHDIVGLVGVGIYEVPDKPKTARIMCVLVDE